MSNYQDMIEELLRDESDTMSDWELKFIEDMSSRLDEGDELTDPQCNKINEIWKKVFG